MSSKKSDFREYIPKSNRRLAEQLAYKKYLEEQLFIINQRLQSLESFRNTYPSSTAAANIHEKGFSELLLPSLLEKDQIVHKWMAEQYEQCPDHTESIKVPTKSGIFVRSKSEAVIADILYENSIPFRYEQMLRLGALKVYPDFTILRSLNPQHVTIWEHFGMMDSPGYAKSAKLKLNAYLDAEYLPGENLILTYESKSRPLDSRYVSLLVSYHFS